MKRAPLLAILLVSCSHAEWYTSVSDSKDAVRTNAVSAAQANLYNYESVNRLLAQIHEGMTLREISRIIPIALDRTHAREHGGICYEALIGTNWVIELRFAPAQKASTEQELRLNLPPQIRSNGSG